MTAAPKFRIDVAINDLLTSVNQRPAAAAEGKGLSLPVPVFPQFPDRLNDSGPEAPPEKRQWGLHDIYRASRGWLFPYVRSRVMPGEFHPITAYLFIEYKCNFDCWYCWSFDNKVKGMTEDVARRSIDWLHDHGCRVVALMGGEPLLRRNSCTRLSTMPPRKVLGLHCHQRPFTAARSGRPTRRCGRFRIQLRHGRLGSEARPP